MYATLLRLFHFKAWADDALLERLAGLGEDSQVARLSLRALHHSYIVDRIFAAHLAGRTHEYATTDPGAGPSLAWLSSELRRSDREYIDYVSALDRTRLEERIDFVFTDGAPGRMSRAEMLMHVVTHGVGHRGQVSALMLLNGIGPAEDGFARYLHEAGAATRRQAPRAAPVVRAAVS